MLVRMIFVVVVAVSSVEVISAVSDVSFENLVLVSSSKVTSVDVTRVAVVVISVETIVEIFMGIGAADVE